MSEERPCLTSKGLRKGGYRSAAKARRVARIQHERGTVGRVKLRIYQCKRCGLWHLTSQP